MSQKNEVPLHLLGSTDNQQVQHNSSRSSRRGGISMELFDPDTGLVDSLTLVHAKSSKRSLMTKTPQVCLSKLMKVQIIL
jgi:hypothetical protein